MDKKFINEIASLYNQQRILSFYKKREKSILIPHLAFYLERLLKEKRNKNTQDKVISVLDIGCGNGNLLAIIQGIFNTRFSDRQRRDVELELHGWDYDKELIVKASKEFPQVQFLSSNLLTLPLEKYYGKFDIVIAVNTLHEVFSGFLLDEKENGKDAGKQFQHAKERFKHLMSQLGTILSDDGTIIIFDGIEEPQANSMTIQFKVKNKILETYIKKFVKENKCLDLKFKKITPDIYESSYRDFTRFATTFKFLNSKFWEIESGEQYQYFTLDDFYKVLQQMGLMIESVNLISNDIGLYQENLEIITPNTYFPTQSILIVGSRRYIPTEFDYFCADLTNGNTNNG